MSHLHKIFAVWDDNAEAMASAIDEKGVTVRQWRNRGDIPSRAAQLKIIRAAYEKDGTVLRLEDFLPPEVVAGLPGHGEPYNPGDRNASATKADDNIGAEPPSTDVANKSDGNICSGSPEVGQSPFSEATSPTCSTIPEQPQPSADSPTSSSSSEAKAA